MLFYSATTANIYKKTRPFDKIETMTTAQRDQLCRTFKKYAIDKYKKSGMHFDGSSKLLSRNVFHVNFYDFYNSPELANLAMSKKLPHYQYFHTGNDVENACKKTITLIKAAGYKAELNGNREILMWKVKK